MHQDEEIWLKGKNRFKLQKKELSNEDIDNLSDAEFKTLVIRMLPQLIELDCKVKEEMKATQNEIRQKYTGNQQCREGNWDLKQQFGTKGRNKNPSGTE